MNRLPHLFIILKPEFQGEGISLLPWSFNSLKMPLTQVVTIGTYSQLEKMEPPTISALSSSWCIFVFKIYFGTVQTQTTSRIHLSDFFKNQRGDSCGEKNLFLKCETFITKTTKKYTRILAQLQPKKKQQHFLFKKKNNVSFQGFNPNIQKSSNPFSWMFPPF